MYDRRHDAHNGLRCMAHQRGHFDNFIYLMWYYWLKHTNVGCRPFLLMLSSMLTPCISLISVLWLSSSHIHHTRAPRHQLVTARSTVQSGKLSRACLVCDDTRSYSANIFFLNSHMLYHLHKVEGISFTNVMNVDNCSSYVARVEQWTAIWTTKVSSILNLVGTRLPKAKLIIGFKTRRYMLVRGYISTKHWYNNTLVLKLDKDYLHKKLF